MKSKLKKIKKFELNRIVNLIDVAQKYNGRFTSIHDIWAYIDDEIEDSVIVQSIYCNEYYNENYGCSKCPLGKDTFSLYDVTHTCCDGLYFNILKSESKESFIDNLKKYKEYIVKNG